MKLFSRKKKEVTPTPATLSIVMQDGTIEEYPENFEITDNVNCVVCGNYYHTHFDCPVLKRDRAVKTNPIIAMKISDAEAQSKEHCYKCQNYDEMEN